MDRLDLAVRRYRQLFPQPPESGRIPQRQLATWLNEDVVPVLEEYSRWPTFREQAAWPLHSLRRGAETKERALIEAVDAQLVTFAGYLMSLTASARFLQQLREQSPPASHIVSQTVEIGGRKSVARDTRWGQFQELDHELIQVDGISGRNWIDLVNERDYLEPEQEFTDVGDGHKVQHADFIVAVNPDLLPIGNFIVRCLNKRVQWRWEVLNSMRKRCLAVERHRSPRQRREGALREKWNDFQSCYRALERRLRPGREMTLIDSCVACTQLYAAWHPEPELDWLGLDDRVIAHGPPVLKHRLTGRQGPHLLERIAAALGDLRQLSVKESPEQSALTKAIATGGLVVTPTEAFWKATPLSQLTRGDLAFLNALAKKAILRTVAATRDVFRDKAVSDSAMSSACNRLRNKVPADLKQLIQFGGTPNTYRLAIEPKQVHVFPAGVRS